MDEAELRRQLSALEAAADSLHEPDKTLAQDKIARIRIKLSALVLDRVSALLQAMSLPKIDEMKSKIAAANDATKAHQERVKLVEDAIDIIQKGLKFVI